MAVNSSSAINKESFKQSSSISVRVCKQFQEITGHLPNEDDLSDGEIQILDVLDAAADGDLYNLKFYYSEVEGDQPDNAHRIADAAWNLATAGKMTEFLEAKRASYPDKPYIALKDRVPSEPSELSRKIKAVAICGMMLIASIYGIQQAAKPVKTTEKAPEEPKESTDQTTPKIPQGKMNGPLPKDRCHPDDAPFHLRVTTNHGPAVRVSSSLTWRQMAQKGWNSFLGAVFGNTNATRIRQDGVEALKNWGETRSPDEIARFPQNEEHDAVYIQKWQMKEQCPSDLSEFIEYQARNEYFNGLNPKVLSPLLGDHPDMSDKTARGLYKVIDRYIPNAVQKIQKKNGNCLDSAMVASTIRSNAREYMRQRMADKKQVKILQERDHRLHGTDVFDPSFVIGKYADKNMTTTCESISQAAERTNGWYSLFARFS